MRVISSIYGIGRANQAGNQPLLVVTSSVLISSSLFANFSGTNSNFGLHTAVYISNSFYL